MNLTVVSTVMGFGHAHLVDESQPTPNNMTNELMKDTQQLPVQVR